MNLSGADLCLEGRPTKFLLLLAVVVEDGR